ncbi:helix-turn-helix domain-containing protein [Acrocarpospora sp. B8E8]|uniref:AraC-like ligand-binding domain-containing protein n=1 Tax=Acrocarpospora sp. B8E8 TaxID=3153572 RepID=UPI00325DD9AE
MTVIVQTASLPPGERAEVVRDVVCDSVVRIEIDHHRPPEDIDVEVRLSGAGRIGICSVRATSTTIRRTPTLARDDVEPAVFLGLQLSGSSMVIQGGREALLRPGDFALYDTATPYTLLFEHGIDQHFFRIPREALALPSRTLREVTALTLGSGNPVAELASAYFARLGGSAELRQSTHADLVAEPSIELIRAVIATQLADRSLSWAPMEATLNLRIMEYLRTHFADRDLSAARIAAAHNISVRYLYTLLARSGISLGDWIRARRLEESRKDLARPATRSLTIAAIAHRWGFTDATHFSKVFKRAYGMSPRAWRDLNRPNESMHA